MITLEMRAAIEETYDGNDELTSTRIKRLLTERWPNLQVSIPTIKRTRKEMGLVCTKPHYRQLLCPVSSMSHVALVYSNYRLLDRLQSNYVSTCIMGHMSVT